MSSGALLFLSYLVPVAAFDMPLSVCVGMQVSSCGGPGSQAALEATAVVSWTINNLLILF